MSTLVVRMECDPQYRDEVVRHLREDVVGWAHQQPGFTRGTWCVTPDGRLGLGFVEFGSLAEAEKAAQDPRGYHDPTGPFRIASVDVFESVATAQRSA